MKLAGEKTTLKLDFNNIITRELNIESLESSLSSILNGVNDTELISNFKSEVVKQYTGENSLVLFKKNSENRLTDSLKKADEKIEEIKQKYEELSEEEFKEYVENLDNGEKEAQKILDALGIDENTTQEDLNKIAEEAAEELVNAIENGKESDNEAINAILDNMNNSDGDGNNNNDDSDNDGNPKGLRYDIYNKIKSIADEGEDIDCIKYSTGIAEVVGKYFTTGVMHIAVHVGGSAIFGVGTSLVLAAKPNRSSTKVGRWNIKYVYQWNNYKLGCWNDDCITFTNSFCWKWNANTNTTYPNEDFNNDFSNCCIYNVSSCWHGIYVF